MRVLVVGGAAGTLLAWRLVQDSGIGRVELVVGVHGGRDATAESAGMIGGSEPDPVQRSLAVDSLAELAGDSTLRCWARWRPTAFLHCGIDPSLAVEMTGAIGRSAPGSADILTGSELAGMGWRVAAGTVPRRPLGPLRPADRRRRVPARRRPTAGTSPRAVAASGRTWRLPQWPSPPGWSRACGAAKTVLAASIRAAHQLKHPHRVVRTGSSKPTLEGAP